MMMMMSSSSTAVPAKLKLVVIGMLLCAWGVAWQMQHLPRTNTRESDITSTSASTSTHPAVQQQQILPSPPSSTTTTTTTLSSYLEQGPELYIPSMEYRIQEQLQILKQQEQQSREHADCSHAAKPLEWEFFNVYTTGNHNTTLSTTTTPTRSVLIGISSGYDEYAKFLTYTAHAAKVYAQQASLHHPNLNVTVVILQGTALAPEGCTPPPIQASLNKIRLFFYAIDQARNSQAYDQVLLLEADALLVADGTTQDLTQLLSKKDPHVLVAGQPYRNTDTPQPPHKINAGATLWNLQHPLVRPVALQWFQSAKEAVYQGTYKGDARHLQIALEEQAHDTNMIQHTTQEFNYQEGTWVQHFLQSGKKITWHDRYKRLQQAHAQLCQRQATVCQQVPMKDYYSNDDDDDSDAAATTITTTKESSFE